MTHSHGTATITEKQIAQKIVKKNEFIYCHQESDYTHYWRLFIEVTNNKIYQDFIAEALILFQNHGFQ